MKNKYRNLWANDLNIKKPEFYENDAREVLRYRQFRVFKTHEKGFDYVFNDCCITQRAGFEIGKAEILIDNILLGHEPVSEQVKKVFPQFKSYSEFE